MLIVRWHLPTSLARQDSPRIAVGNPLSIRKWQTGVSAEAGLWRFTFRRNPRLGWVGIRSQETDRGKALLTFLLSRVQSLTLVVYSSSRDI